MFLLLKALFSTVFQTKLIREVFFQRIVPGYLLSIQLVCLSSDMQRTIIVSQILCFENGVGPLCYTINEGDFQKSILYIFAEIHILI